MDNEGVARDPVLARQAGAQRGHRVGQDMVQGRVQRGERRGVAGSSQGIEDDHCPQLDPRDMDL